jgi:molybdate transport system substrate-binding protein
VIVRHIPGVALLAAWGLALSGCAERDGAPETGTAGEVLTLFAAVSLTDALDETCDAFESEHGIRVLRNYASSSILAKQIDAGAPANVFVSAHPEWMEWLATRGRLAAESERVVAGNALVLVAPKGRGFAANLRAPLAGAFAGRFALGDPDHVPAGMYARAALEHLGWWAGVEPRVVRAADARAAVALVGRGECGAGVVYATDAEASERVEVVMELPETSHPPVRYPGAVVVSSPASAHRLLAWMTEPPAQAVFRAHGFAASEGGGP